MEELNDMPAWTIIYLFALHLLGVIKHQFIDRVILGRMTGPGQGR
jgi:cytochrome b561